MSNHEAQTKLAGGSSELIDGLCFGVFRPVAWIRKHPDGTLAGEMLTDANIECCRTASGAWEPMYTRSALLRVLDHAKQVHAHNEELYEQMECVRQALPEVWRESVPSVAVATIVAELEAAQKTHNSR